MKACEVCKLVLIPDNRAVCVDCAVMVYTKEDRFTAYLASEPRPVFGVVGPRTEYKHWITAWDGTHIAECHNVKTHINSGFPSSYSNGWRVRYTVVTGHFWLRGRLFYFRQSGDSNTIARCRVFKKYCTK